MKPSENSFSFSTPKQILFVTKTVLFAASLVLTASVIYLIPRHLTRLNFMLPLYELGKNDSEMTSFQTIKGRISLCTTTPDVTHTTRLEGKQKISLAGTASSSDEAEDLNLDEQFQNVNDKNVWVYSAHYDDFNDTAPVLHILGIGKIASDGSGIYCHVTEQGKSIIFRGKQENIQVSFDKNDSVAFFRCVLNKKFKPSSVSLTFNITDKPTNRIRVVYPKTFQRNFTVCHAALFNFSKPYQIINSFEINRVFGAQHFFVYNHSVSNTTDAVLRHYKRLGLLTVMPWRLPASGVWYHGQLLAINDCVYRNRHVSKFVVIQDTDEFIIPEVHDSWAEVLKAAENDYFKGGTKSKDNQTVGSFLFQNSFYYNTSDKLWESIKRNFSMTSDEETFLSKNSVFPFLHTLKDGKIYQFNVRSKVIVKPQWAIITSIHGVQKHRTSAETVVVNRALAVLHHYRYYPNTNVTDVSALRFMKTAMPVLRAAYSSLDLVGNRFDHRDRRLLPE